MRYLYQHLPGEKEEGLRVEVGDEPGEDGACRHYVPYFVVGDHSQKVCDIRFQKGSVQDNGPNGVTLEALLAVVIDRLDGLQSGPLSCRENALAKTHAEEALHWLHARTRDRKRRGVEGTKQK